MDSSNLKTPNNLPPKDPLAYKILVVGDMGTGKTSLVKRFTSDNFSINYKATIGVDFGVKKTEVDGKETTLHFWDIAGQERFGSMTRIYYQLSHAALVVFDVTRQSTFENAKKWKQDIDTKVRFLESDVLLPVILLANKVDLLTGYPSNERDEDEGWGIPVSEMDQYCEQNGFIKWFETSAKDNINIFEAVSTLVRTIRPLDELQLKPEVEHVVITPKPQKKR